MKERPLYAMRIHDDLLIALRGHNLPDYKIFGHFNDLINKAITSEPTYKKGDRVKWAFIQHGNQHNETFATNFWIHREYYPDTGIFYKMTVLETNREHVNEKFFAKIEMKVRPTKTSRRKRKVYVPAMGPYAAGMQWKSFGPAEHCRHLYPNDISDLILEGEIFGQVSSEPLKLVKQKAMFLKGWKDAKKNRNSDNPPVRKRRKK